MMHTSQTMIPMKAGRRVSAVLFAAAVALLAAGPTHAQDALRIGDTGNVGLGIDSPERQLHLRGSQAVVRLDRSTDAATFMMVRTDSAGKVWKTFSVGTRASGVGVGEFVIQDFGQSTSGASQRRMTITNTGEAHFTGTVRAPAFVQSSSQHFKKDILTLTEAGQSLKQLRGVRFSWKDSGRQSVGFIAEEVAEVYPELVDQGIEEGTAAVNYSALVAVLVEAFKDQQAELAAYQSQVAAQQVQLTLLANRLAEFETLQARFNRIEDLLMRTEPSVVVLSR